MSSTEIARMNTVESINLAMPRPAGHSRTSVEELYAMMLDEVRDPRYNDRELALFSDPVWYYGRYLNPASRNYALRNADANVSVAIQYLRSDASSVRLLDLGCGLGMQSIIFAALGWDVVGVDVSEECVALCRKRKQYFEQRLHRELNLRFVALDFKKADADSVGRQFDALFSMSAFAHIRPLQETVAKVADLLTASGRVFLWDQNPGYLLLDSLGLNRRRVSRPNHIREELARHGFTTELLRGACAIPRQLWREGILEHTASQLNSVLNKSMTLSFSYLLGAARNPAQLKSEAQFAKLS
jgi:2-polyprenyl-3-methyl-5-hydroxy-6-metoxy-1,4-benzoquinol methylase